MKKILLSLLLLGFAHFALSQTNTSVGSNAGNAGTNNTSIGYYAGRIVGGNYNSFLGSNAGYYITTGSFNSFLGYRSGVSNTSGDKNLNLGAYSGNLNSTGSGNIFIGYQAGYYETSSDKLYIENSSSSSPLIYGDFASNILTVNGTLGIGTQSPTAVLTINGRSNNRLLDGYNTVNNLMFQINTLGGNPHMDFYDHDGVTVDLKLNTNGNSFFNGGNLGIGNSNPTAKVHIYDTESLGGVWNPALSYLTIAGFGSSLIMDSNEIYSDNSLNFGSSYTHDITFRNVDADGNQDLMVIKPTGNIGIGTSTPGSKLAVNGKITAREVEVTAEGWADFVFEKDYDLPSLMDIEAHIKEKKHLPGIPSAAEVEENGINLGAMDALLLQKIEELTLYMIEQEKINKKQSALITKMEEENKQLYQKISALEAN